MAFLLSTNLHEAGWLEESRPQHQMRTWSRFNIDLVDASALGEHKADAGMVTNRAVDHGIAETTCL